MSSQTLNENNQETANLFGDIFAYDHSSKKSICLLNKGEKKCSTNISSKRPSNLKRHIARVHPNFTATIIENDTSHCIETEILNSFTEMFTLNGRPFSLLKDSGFSKIYKILVDQIQKNTKQKVHIDINKVKDHIEVTKKEMVEKLKNEVKNKPIALMMDIATKNNRTILGVNIQYVIGNRIVLRTLRMIRLDESHTAKHLADVVVKILAEFEISMDQLFSVTTDNAGYMLLSSEILDEFATNNVDIEDEELLELEDEDFYRRMLKEAEEEFLTYAQPDHVKSIPCGAHRFQLAINDTFTKCQSSDKLVAKVRLVAKKLRTPNIYNVLREKQLKFPLIDNKTRWNGKYTMVSVISPFVIFYDCKNMYLCRNILIFFFE